MDNSNNINLTFLLQQTCYDELKMNKEIAIIFDEIARLLEIKGDSLFRINATRKVAMILDGLQTDIEAIYKERGIKGIKEIKGIGESSAKKIEEYIKRKRIKSFEELKEETGIRQVITHFFKSKGLSLQELKENAKKRKII